MCFVLTLFEKAEMLPNSPLRWVAGCVLVCVQLCVYHQSLLPKPLSTHVIDKTLNPVWKDEKATDVMFAGSNFGPESVRSRMRGLRIEVLYPSHTSFFLLSLLRFAAY